MAKRQISSPKPTEQDGSIAAHVTFELGQLSGTYKFERIAVSADDPNNLCITLASSEGKLIKVVLLRAEVRKLISWRMLVNL
jgi:hypothetical protein